MKRLVYLDDRPVTDSERLSTNAWSEGGAEAERTERLRQLEAKEATYEANFAG